VKPGAAGGCVSERDWRPDLQPALSALSGAGVHETRGNNSTLNEMQFRHRRGSSVSMLVPLVLLSISLLACAAVRGHLGLRNSAYSDVARGESIPGRDDEEQELLMGSVTELRSRLRTFWEEASRSKIAHATASLPQAFAALPWKEWLASARADPRNTLGGQPAHPTRSSRVAEPVGWPGENEFPELRFQHGSDSDGEGESFAMLGDSDEAALLARVASLLDSPHGPELNPVEERHTL
jgi:hypothetical protein